MINSFKDLINESNSPGIVKEMGVKRPERLSGSQMGRIRQSSIDRAAQLANRPQTRQFEEVALELKRAIKGVRRLDITMDHPANTRNYYPQFPQPIVDLMTELWSIDRSRAASEFWKWRDMYPGDSDAIHFRTEGPSDNQRSHFPNNGIPSMLRGTGLGYKLYRTLLKYAGYLSSNTSGTTEKDRAWGSLLAYKSNPDGTPSEDDAHAIIGPSNWMAIDKQTLSTARKVEAAERFIRSINLSNTMPDRFDMDDELISILSDEFLSEFKTEYLTYLKQEGRITEERYDTIISQRGEAQRREQERQERQERERREQLAAQEAETRRQMAARIERFGAKPDEDWTVGDFIVVKSYLYQEFDALPIRRVVSVDGRNYKAAKISDCIRLDRGEITPANLSDARTTSTKSDWVKVDITAIPDLSNVNLSREEKDYIKNRLNPQEIEARAEAERTAANQRIEAGREENAERAENLDNTLGIFPASGLDLKRMITITRPTLGGIELLKKLRSGNFTSIIVLGEEQRRLFRNSWGVPAFVPFRELGRGRIAPVDDIDVLTTGARGYKLINAVTGHIVEAPFTGLGLMAYPLAEVTFEDKMRARAGDHFYVANHQNNWGIVAPCDYGTRNTSDQKFIYVKAFGLGQRSVAVRLDMLRKLGAPVSLG